MEMAGRASGGQTLRDKGADGEEGVGLYGRGGFDTVGTSPKQRKGDMHERSPNRGTSIFRHL